jgi:hypothetical protein
LGVYNLRVSSMGAPITLDQIFLAPPGSEQVNTLRRGKNLLRRPKRQNHTPTRHPTRLLQERHNALGKRLSTRP